MNISRLKLMVLVLILGSLAALGPLSIDMYLPGLPDLTADLETSTSHAQLSLTACLLGLAAGQLLVGPLSDVRGRKKPLIAAMLCYMAASLLCAFSPTIWVLVFLRFIQGASGAAGIVISRASVRDMSEGTELTKLFSMLMLVNGAAPILAPIIGGQLLNFVSWRGIFAVLAGIGILLWLAVLFSLPETLPKNRRADGGTRKTVKTYHMLLRDKEFMVLAFTQGLIMAAMFAYISGSPFVMQNIFGVSPQMFSLMFAINGVGIIVASQTTGRLAGRIAERKMLVFGLCWASAGSALLLISSVFQTGLPGILSGLFLVVSSVGIVGPTSFSLAMAKQEGQAGSAAALLGVLPFLLGATAAPLVGIAGSGSELPMAIVIFICDSLALLLFLSLRKKAERVIRESVSS